MDGKKFGVLPALYLLALQTNSLAGLQPIDLTCENVKDPISIDVKTPRFGWVMVSSLRNQQQSAYELIVCDNIVDIKAGKGNTWSSGMECPCNF